jgi:hypothetical protein
MKLLAAGILSWVFLAALMAAPPRNQASGTPRLLLKVVGAAGPDAVRATVENLAAHPVAISVVPAFVLRPSTPDEVGWPAFRAPIDTVTARPLAVNGSVRLQLAPNARQTVVVPLESLYWDHYESALWPSRPLRRVVLPGRYDLTLEIHDPDAGSWWRSDPIAAVVKKAGSLQLVKPD